MTSKTHPEVGIYVGNHRGRRAIEGIQDVLIAFQRYLDPKRVRLYGNTALNETLERTFDLFKTSRTAKDTLPSTFRASYADTLEYIDSDNPDVLLHLTNYINHGPAIALAGRRRGLPTIVRVPGDVFKVYTKYDGLRRAAAFALHNVVGRLPVMLADRVIVLGPYGERQVSRRRSSSDGVVVIPPPVPSSERFNSEGAESHLREQIGVSESQQLSLYVGPVENYKGMDFLERVIDCSDDVTFLLVGAGARRSELVDKYPNQVVAPGYVPHDELPTWYRAADVLVHPSPHEGVPLVILEAMSCGTPVVARRAGDIEHFIPNVVETPEEMARRVRERDYVNVVRNYRDLSPKTQAERLNRIVDELV